MRWARRTDDNQKEIVEAFRKLGAKVKVIHQPVDLKVWATTAPDEHRTMLVEVKNPNTAYGRKGLNDKQAEEMDGLPHAMVDSVDAAIRALNVLRSSK